MFRIVLLSFGIVLVVLGCLLLVFGLAKFGINEGEWRNISHRGLPSIADQLQWSSWQVNDGSVYPFPSFQPERRPEILSEYRIGHMSGPLFGYSFYQGRFVRDGVTYEFPALGPGWGTVYHPLWPCVSLAVGLLSLFVARKWSPLSPPIA